MAAAVERRLGLTSTSSDEAGAAPAIDALCRVTRGYTAAQPPARSGSAGAASGKPEGTQHSAELQPPRLRMSRRGLFPSGEPCDGSAVAVLAPTPSAASITAGGQAPTRRCARPRPAQVQVGGSTGRLRCCALPDCRL